jgi:hypothetical protein
VHQVGLLFQVAIQHGAQCVQVQSTRWFKYDRDWLYVNKSQFVPVIFEPPCIKFIIITVTIFLAADSKSNKRKGTHLSYISFYLLPKWSVTHWGGGGWKSSGNYVKEHSMSFRYLAFKWKDNNWQRKTTIRHTISFANFKYTTMDLFLLM